ncbi:MAG: sulfatase [Planctomycetota bacterium]
MKYGIGIVSLSLFWATVGCCEERPNIVLIVGDDWGWTDFGFMKGAARTPNLDRLAREGALFPNGYTPTSLCRASLATILTGLFPSQHRICVNDPPKDVPREAMHPFIEQAPTVPRSLKQAGYRCLQTGKFWEGHFSRAGFTAGMTVKGRHGDDGLAIGRKTMAPIFEFIDGGKGPFFLWYAPMMPHQPHDPPERLLERYQSPERDPRLAKYLAMCEWTDETIGELLDGLKKRNLDQTTLVLFVVDNGWVQATGPAKPNDQFLTRSKRTPYEAGIRTPLILSWPGKIKPAIHADLVSTIDIAPTLLSAAGVPVPSRLQGLNLLPVAEGSGDFLRQAVFGEIFLHTAKTLEDPKANLTQQWVRSGEWKLIQPLQGPDGGAPIEPAELYRVSVDPFEKENLAAGHPEEVRKLRGMLARWRQTLE